MQQKKWIRTAVQSLEKLKSKIYCGAWPALIKGKCEGCKVDNIKNLLLGIWPAMSVHAALKIIIIPAQPATILIFLFTVNRLRYYTIDNFLSTGNNSFQFKNQ